MTKNVVTIEYVDYDEQYGMFGKVVARSDVRGYSPDRIEREKRDMVRILGGHVACREVEDIPAIRR